MGPGHGFGDEMEFRGAGPMCGIAGYVGAYVPGLMTRMNAAQQHRGPDGSGIFEDPYAAASLGHVRLAILDLSDQAAQPMVSRDERFVLVFNGEIYNFRELRNELASDGIPFASSGDTEVLLRGLARFGQSFLNRLNGIFALALWDRVEQELLLARDQVGVKPVYYAEPESGTLLFASEIKALCAHPRLRREPDFDTIRQHLTFCHALGDRTAMAGVKRLPPAGILRWKARTRKFELQTYWSPRYSTWNTNFGTRADGVERLREELADASRRQLVSDVPVGSLLSGGLDSSLITTLAAPHARTGLSCYTISYPGKENRIDRMVEDAPYAASLANELRLPLHNVSVDANAADLWSDLIHYLDEPIADPAAITCYLLSKLAREHGTKVLLSGQGADELFAGYPRYAALHALRLMKHVPAPLRAAVAKGAQLLPGARTGRTGVTLRRTRRILREIAKNPVDQFLAWCAATPSETVAPIFSPEVRDTLHETTDDDFRHPLRARRSDVDACLDRDFSVYLPNHNLLYTDKMGMAVGVETRVPLLDMRLVSLATSFPSDWKLRPTIKGILRDAARGTIPGKIIDRPKAGFGAPFRHWLRHDLAELWNEVSCERTVRARGWFDHRVLGDIRKQSQLGRADLYMLQWAVLTTELWARRFLDENPAGAAKPVRTAPHVVTLPAAA
ncbi:MAG: asparagine synthase (glutamine-hydrolyzing) [Planctomycetaceae bacterium]